MKKFIKSIAIFISPLIILSVVLYGVDPYSIFRQENNNKLRELKKQISYRINYPLYKITQYYYNPTDIIVLGDSRAGNLNKSDFDSIANENITNLAYASSSINEITETFWLANSIHKLKKVYIGINFNQYNVYHRNDRVKEAIILRNSKLSYLYSRYCIKSSFYILHNLITNRNIEIEKPPFTKEEFWEYQLKETAPLSYKKYKHPSTYYNALHAISEYCLTNNIKLVVFISPTHIDLQSKIKEFGREKEYIQFLNDLSSLDCDVFDFNFENSMTKSKQNFGDPYHFNNTYKQIIIKVISSDKHKARTHNNVYKSLGR